MDKGKNRGDLLAAGRKKLMQFRQKKDGKGGGGDPQGKPSQKAGKSTKVSVNPDKAAPDRESEKPAVVAPECSDDGEASETADLPVAAILTRSLTEDDPNLAADDASRSNGGALEDGCSGDRIDTHGKECSSLGLDEGNDSRSFASESTRQDGNSDRVVWHLEDMKAGIECESRVSTSSREDSSVQTRPGGDRAQNTLQETSSVHGVISTPMLNRKSSLQTPEDSDRDTPLHILESERDSDVAVENPADVVIAETDSSLFQPQANRESGDFCSTSVVITEVEVAEISGETERLVPIIDDRTSTVMGHFQGNENSNDRDTQMHDTVSFSATPCEKFEVAGFSVQTPDVGTSQSEKGVTLASDGIIGAIDGLLAIEIQHPLTSSTETEPGLDITEAKFVSSSEDLEKLAIGNDASLLNQTMLLPSSDLLDLRGTTNLSAYMAEEAEQLKHHLYLTNVTNGFLQLQLEEQLTCQDGHNLSFSEDLSGPHDAAKMAEENTASIYRELEYCRIELQAVTSKKEEVELQLISAKGDNEVLKARINELQSQIESWHEDLTATTTELLELKAEVAAAQIEVPNLHMRLISEAEERKKLEAEKEFLISENTKLACEISEQKERLFITLNEHMQLEKDLKESLVPLEKLSEENLSLSICLDCYKFKLKDLDGMRILLPQADEFHSVAHNLDTQNVVCDTVSKDLQGSVGYGTAVPVGKLYSGATSTQKEDLHPLQSGNCNAGDVSSFLAWKRHLEEASEMITELEKTIQSLHRRSISLSRVGGRVTTSGISKLILAFDSKGQMDDSVKNETSSAAEGEDSTNSLLSAKEQMKVLRNILVQLDSDVERASLLCHDQEEHIMRGKELMLEYEAQKLQNNHFHAKILELVRILSNCKDFIDDLENHLETMSRSTSYETECFYNELEVLQKEVVKCMSSLEREKALEKEALILSIKKLDASTGFLAPSDGDLAHLVNASIDAASNVIEYLKKEIDLTKLDYDTKCTIYSQLQGEFMESQKINDFALEILAQIYVCFRELTDGSCEKLEEKYSSIGKYEQLDSIKQDSEVLSKKLKKMLHERVELLIIKEELEDTVLKKSKVIEELGERCKKLEKDLVDVSRDKSGIDAFLVGIFQDVQRLNNYCSVLAKKYGDRSAVSFLGDVSPDGDLMRTELNTQMSQLEAFVASLFEKYEEINNDFSLCKNYLGELEPLANFSGDMSSMPLHVFLKEVVAPKLMDSNELQERFLSLSSLSSEKGDETQLLKESLSKMEEALKAKCCEFDSKVAELELSEQKLSSVREKLSIAVAKGKGLVVQRDHLKQSLLEKTNELEKCLQELQTKETVLHEVEAKLKSYSEVDRIEALESELSYIRNSATAFRDSFLLKEDILQSIEEVLEDLDLPENYCSKDIVEKVKLLARSVANNSFMVNDWSQNPVDDSNMDAGLGCPDASKEDESVAPVSESDELRRRFDELQRKFYGLAEHNDMLEQSLMERHSIIQRWEELLDMIDMPAYLRSMEPIVRLEWLGKALPEVQREQDSLLTKIEDFEELNRSLTRNLEELQIKNSQLEAALFTVGNERESLASQVEKLRLENSELIVIEAQNEELQRKVLGLETTLNSIVNENVSLSTQVDKLRHDNSEKEAQNEEFQRKILELEKALHSVENERGSLFDEVDKLRLDNLEFSRKEAQHELDRVHLQKDILDLQGKLDESINKVDHKISERIKDIQILVDDALGESEHAHKLSHDNPIDNLEVSLQKLVSNYTTLFRENSMTECSRKLSVDGHKISEQKLKDLLEDKEKDLDNLKSQLSEASHHFTLIEEERNAISGKHQSLIQDMEEMIRERNTLLTDNGSALRKCDVLQSELMAMKAQLEEAYHRLGLAEEAKNTISEEHHMLKLELEEMIKHKKSLLAESETTLEKYQGLQSEVELLSRQRDTLTEQLNQEEQRSASWREKLNVAVRKGKGLVQQRDGLKQAVEELSGQVEKLQNQINQSTVENSSLRNKLAETERLMQDNGQMLTNILTALHSIDTGESPASNPVQMLEGIGKLLKDRLTTAQSKEHEAMKSRKAAELLLAELNEVQDRVDCLQEELSKNEAALAQCYRERDEAEAARVDAISKLEQAIMVHSEERKREANDVLLLRSRISDLRNSLLDALNLISETFSKDFDLIHNLAANADSILKLVNATIQYDLVRVLPLQEQSSRGMTKENKYATTSLPQNLTVHPVAEHLHLARQGLTFCLEELSNLEEAAHEHSASVEQQARFATVAMEAIEREIDSLNISSEPLSSMMNRIEMSNKAHENEIAVLLRCLVLLFEACKSSIFEIESKKQGKEGLDGESEAMKMIMDLESCSKKEGHEGKAWPFTEDHVKMIAKMLLSTVRGSESGLEEIVEGKVKKLKSLISDLQRELQEKDIQKNSICAELVSQINDAESLAKKHSADLEYAKRETERLKNQLKMTEDEKMLLEQKMHNIYDLEISSKDLQGKINSLTESLTAKDQEIEALMQALDEEESQMESLQVRNQELQKALEENSVVIESLEASRGKAVMKLSTTVNKFDELHQLSENLLAEIENLQSQMQDKDSEISFLRQEVMRCTNDALAEQESNKKKINDVHQLQQWITAMFSRFGVTDLNFEHLMGSHFDVYKELLDDTLLSVVAKFDDVWLNSQNKDALLQIEKDRVHELMQKTKFLETSLHEKESQIVLYQRTRDSGQVSTADSSDHQEIESVRNKGAASSSVVPLIRSGRKITSDQVAIGMDLEQGNILEDEDDDKAHGFKSLTLSKVVPRFTRPVADRIDGLWVSIDRLLMRQPSLRLGLIIYWIALHAMLAASI